MLLSFKPALCCGPTFRDLWAERKRSPPFMSISKIVWLNVLLIASIGVFGVLVDAPYWRSVGQSAWLYDYFFFAALALNGPSGLVADFVAWLVTNKFIVNRQLPFWIYYEWRFAIQYTLWVLLLWPQWKAYDFLIGRYLGRRYR